jgi:predicted DNA-binding protein with PD1-like motif
VGPEEEVRMKSRLIDGEGGEKIFVLVLDTGDEVVSEITNFARENDLDAASITAMGAFSGATLAYFDIVEKEYEKIPLEEQVEVLSLIGEIALNDAGGRAGLLPG